MQIANTILKATTGNSGGLTGTKIMYSSFLSYAKLKDYFFFLVTNGLLHYNDDTEKYTVIGKGFTFMEQYAKLVEIIPESKF